VRASDSKLPCRQKLHPQAREGIRLLNRGAFFEAHEALERAWRQETSLARDLYRGILQVAVVYYHLRRGNYAGVVKVYQRCLKWLRPWSPLCQGVRVDTLLADLETVIHEVRDLGPDNLGSFDPGHIKPVRLYEPDPAAGEGMLCDRCGHEMVAMNCRLVCPNCGFRYDCSDLTLYFD
jgi:hypothetical protein